MAGAYEIAMHLTGKYPDWWTGLRFHRPVRVMCGSESGELTRKGAQRLLLGPPEKRDEWGTGAIPKDCVMGHSMKAGVADAVSSLTVKNEYGGDSVVQFNSYDQGRTKWQADTVDIVWFDEEPPLDIYSEGLTRTQAVGGVVFVTFTPLLGMSQVVKRFLMEKPAGSVVVRMTIDDAEHYSKEQREAIIAAYPEQSARRAPGASRSWAAVWCSRWPSPPSPWRRSRFPRTGLESMALTSAGATRLRSPAWPTIGTRTRSTSTTRGRSRKPRL